MESELQVICKVGCPLDSSMGGCVSHVRVRADSEVPAVRAVVRESWTLAACSEGVVWGQKGG